MDAKSRVLIIILLLLFLASGFMAYKFYTDYQNLDREYTDRRQEWAEDRDTLESNLDQWKRKAQTYEGELTEMDMKLNEYGKQIKDLQSRYTQVASERDNLMDKVAELQAKRPIMPMAPDQEGITDDERDAYWAQVVKERATFEAKSEQLAQQLASMKQVKEEVEEQLKEMERDMKTLQDHAGELQRQVDFNARTVQILSEELVREKEDKRQMTKDLQEFRQDNLAMKRDLKRLNHLKALLEKDLASVKEEKDRLSVKLDEMNTLIKDRTSAIMDLKDKVSKQVQLKDVSPESSKAVELPPIVVSPQRTDTMQTVMTRPATEGKVIAINKENNFVIVDLGETQGVKPGMSLVVFRNNTQIADLEVIETRKEISACDIIQIKPGIELGIGDTVK